MLSLIKSRFIDSFVKNTYDDVGVEIELQLVNFKNKTIDAFECVSFLEKMSAYGYFPSSYSDDGLLYAVKNNTGSVIMFDSAYNILELILRHEPNIYTLKERFETMFDHVSDTLRGIGYYPVGLGVNPFFPNSVSVPIRNKVYLAQNAFFTANGGVNLFHHISSVQTHLDCPLDKLPAVVNMFNKLDFVNLYLFANAPNLIELQTDIRDEIYSTSRLNTLGLTGSVDRDYLSCNDLLLDYASRYVFYLRTEQQVSPVKPVPLINFLEKYPNNINDFISCKNVEITEYGTIEQRGIPTQPVSEMFVPVAFQKGAALSYERVTRIIDEFFEQYKLGFSNSQMRRYAACCDTVPVTPPGVSPPALSRLLTEIVEAAFSSLKELGQSEEELLLGLFERAERLQNPSSHLLRMLSEGKDLVHLLKGYGDLNAKDLH